MDLHNYITMIKGEAGIPHSIRVGRFTVKSYLVKMAAQVEQHRWLVLDLQQKTMSWFVDNNAQVETPEGRQPIHDDRLVSAALVSVYDELIAEGKMRVGQAKSAVIPPVDPLAAISS